MVAGTGSSAGQVDFPLQVAWDWFVGSCSIDTQTMLASQLLDPLSPSTAGEAHSMSSRVHDGQNAGGIHGLEAVCTYASDTGLPGVLHCTPFPLHV